MISKRHLSNDTLDGLHHFTTNLRKGYQHFLKRNFLTLQSFSEMLQTSLISGRPFSERDAHLLSHVAFHNPIRG